MNVREYRKCNQECTTQRNWLHWVHTKKTRRRQKKKQKTQHNMCWTPLFTNKH